MEIKSKLLKTGYELESINIVQSEKSDIAHRSECDPMIEMCGRKVYPVIVAPMGAVTNEHNYKIWLENNFICVVPRTVNINRRLEICKETFASFSLSETEEVFLNKINEDTDLEWFTTKHYICIDIAHGTMEKLYNICKSLKDKFGEHMEIMTGNVANPNAYLYYASYGIDYQRLSVGTGSRCVAKGTQIKMADGTYLPIENIDKGDYVETMNGPQKVLNTFSKQTKSTLLVNGNIETTPNHKFFVLKKEDFSENITDDEIRVKGFYLEADKLSDKYLLVQE